MDMTSSPSAPDGAGRAVAKAAESVRRLPTGRVSTREVADLVARLRGITHADPAERAGFLADKRALVERIETDHTRGDDDTDDTGLGR